MASSIKRMVVRSGITEEKEKQCLCRLPVELLLMILSHLSVLDYLSFRGVCKCWRKAFSQCPVSQNQARRQLPWFLLLSTEFPEELSKSSITRPLLHTTGKLGDLSTRHIYSTDIPELCGTQILLSKHGWLLLFSSSLFFFNPFSRARIDLPFLDVTKLCNPAFDISAPPTSPDCMVFVICCDGYKLICVDRYKLEISLCCHGESAWTTNVYKNDYYRNYVVNTVFVKGMWYCLHKHGYFSVFDVVNRKLKFLGQPERMITNFDVNLVSYVIKRGDEVSLCVHGGVCYEIQLRDPLEFVGNSLTYWLEDVEYLFRSDLEGAIVKFQDVLQVDSFNSHAWCGVFDLDDVISFRWHHFRSFVNNFHPLDGKSCLRDNLCSRTIIWIEPTWVHSSPKLSWSS